jgi:CTP synthase (UTP-ammonia lyase)
MREAATPLPIIALVGDYSPTVVAHQAIPRALELIKSALRVEFAWRWVRTAEIRDAARDLAGFAGVWLVPASPYASMDGALQAVRWARENRRPFLGTCGGFQHALIEFARHAAGLATADHAETNPEGDTSVVAPLSCSLVEKIGTVHFAAGSRLRAMYGQDRAVEGYHCNYGLNPAYAEALERHGLHFTARDDAGEVRAFELPEALHPFFIGTLFQPERAALRGEISPVAAAFARAALA